MKQVGERITGHEKGDGRYVLDRRPDAILFFLLEASPAPLDRHPRWAQAARQAAFGTSEKEIAADPRFARSYEPRSHRLPDGTWLNWFARRAEF